LLSLLATQVSRRTAADGLSRKMAPAA
jgi:hypothetical protein